MKIKNIYIFIFICFEIVSFAQNKKHILLANGVAHLGNGKVMRIRMWLLITGK